MLFLVEFLLRKHHLSYQLKRRILEVYVLNTVRNVMFVA